MKLRGLVLLSLFCSYSYSQGAFSEKGVGHYWTKKGDKVEGEFKISYKSHLAGGAVVKQYRNGKKVGRVNVYDLQSLVLDQDSFIVGYGFTLDSWANYDADLLRVEKTGKINLYSHCRKVKQSMGNSIPISYLVCRYVIKKESSKSFIGIATKNQFEANFIPLIQENVKLKEKVMGMKRRNWIDFLPDFIEEYNQNN